MTAAGHNEKSTRDQFDGGCCCRSSSFPSSSNHIYHKMHALLSGPEGKAYKVAFFDEYEKAIQWRFWWRTNHKKSLNFKKIQIS
jgi:hypothetical protein